jgi:hypothetical protein
MGVHYIGNNNPDGMSFGSSTSEKVSVHGVTPVVQQSHIADATDAATAISQLNLALAVLESYGFVATS